MVSFKKIKYRYQGKFDPDKLLKTNIDYLSTRLVKPKTKVLELGAATGFMSEHFRKHLGCKVVGVDINPEAQPDIVGDLNSISTWKKIRLQSPYDVVFASSVLEHLPSPETTLQLIKAVLKPGGRLIATTGNVAWWRQRLNAVLGRFEYEDYGIMDRTHLRFFTYFTFQELIRDAGFSIKSVAIDPGGGVKYLNWLVKYFPNLYAHQICIYAQK